MPKLPDVTALGGRPTPRATRGVGNVTAVGRGVQQAANITANAAGRVGQGGAALAKGLGQAGEVFQRIQEREEGLARDSDDTAYSEQLSDYFRQLEATGDFSDKETITQAGLEAKSLRDKILSGHRGGNQSKALLRNRLESRRISFGDGLAVKSINAVNSKQRESFDRRNNAITASISEDPATLLEPDLDAVFRKYDEILEKEIEFINPSPAAIAAFRTAGRENIVSSMITPMIQEGNFNRAKDLLRSDAIKEILDPATRRDFAGRIIAAERKLGEGAREGEAAMETARTVLGPTASDEQIRSAAANIVGLSESQNLEFFKVGQDVVGINKSTGSVAARIPGPSIEEQTELAGEVERSKLLAKAEVIQQILQAAGAEPLPGPEEVEGAAGEQVEQVEGPAVLSPFGEQQPASVDAQSVARLFTASRRLALVGETSMANNFLSQARFIAENSTDMQRQRELDKPISAELASELGVSVGTPLRAVLGAIPPSPGQLAKERGMGTAQGRQQVENQEQLGFIDEARIMVGDLLDEIETDPGIVGIRGSLRATGQTAVSVLGDLGFDALADTARELAFENTELGLNSITDMFESPTLSALDIMENSIGLILARLRTPQGRIPVDVIKRSIDDVQLKGLKGSKQIQNRLEFVLNQLERRSKAIRERSGEQPKSSDLPQFRIENGQLIPVEQ